ncbi:hypothetical protein V6N12_030847 [Hibiscus sabdariffa]|uniref:Uncharacterized protein n=1 Tax=Hibiscus sabdariffa TaxID=183260 RepID=A0ABR2E775_9ROSI
MHGSEKWVLLRGSGSEHLSKDSNKGEQGGKVVVASKDVVVQEPITLNMGTHVAVRVGSQGGDRTGNQTCKKQVSRQSNKVGLDEWVGNLDRELERSARGGESSSLGGGEQRMAETVEV